MNKNPLIDALAIFVCLLMVIAVGHYYKIKLMEHKESSLQRVETPKPKIDLSKFETSVKVTE